MCIFVNNIFKKIIKRKLFSTYYKFSLGFSYFSVVGYKNVKEFIDSQYLFCNIHTMACILQDVKTQQDTVTKWNRFDDIVIFAEMAFSNTLIKFGLK